MQLRYVKFSRKGLNWLSCFILATCADNLLIFSFQKRQCIRFGDVVNNE